MIERGQVKKHNQRNATGFLVPFIDITKPHMFVKLRLSSGPGPSGRVRAEWNAGCLCRGMTVGRDRQTGGVNTVSQVGARTDLCVMCSSAEKRDEPYLEMEAGDPGEVPGEQRTRGAVCAEARTVQQCGKCSCSGAEMDSRRHRVSGGGVDSELGKGCLVRVLLDIQPGGYREC